MTEYRVGNAIVRMHGTPDLGKVRAAAEQFLKEVEKQRRQKAGGEQNAETVHGRSISGL